MWFTLHSKRAACVLQAMEGKDQLGDYSLLRSLKQNVTHAVLDAMAGGPPGWVLSVYSAADDSQRDELRAQLRTAHQLAHGGSDPLQCERVLFEVVPRCLGT